LLPRVYLIIKKKKFKFPNQNKKVKITRKNVFISYSFNRNSILSELL